MKKSILHLCFLLILISSNAQTIQTFTTEETTTWVAPEGVTSVSVLVVGGGGSGGNHTTTNANGGGGGGGVVYDESYTVVPGESYTVTVGSGGAAICNGCSAVGNNGENSVFGTLIALGGGGGGSTSNGPGQDGGSGGGAAYDYAAGASLQSAGFGNAGGATAVTWTGAGGGGAGSAGNVGENASPGGNGGAGYESSITGTAVKYAGGGGGGGNSSERAGDGYDGGGRGSGTTTEYNYNQYVEEVNATTGGSGTPDAIPNTGGGGGGGSYWSPNVGWTTGSGAGGSGVVILSYSVPNTPPTFTSVPVTTIEAGDAYSYTVTTDDANEDNVTVTAPTKPAWLNLNTNYSVTTLAGSGSIGSTDANGTSASFSGLYGIAVDVSGNVYVAETENSHKIRKIAPNGDVSTLAGSESAGSLDANGTNASFNNPIGVTVDASGNVYVADRNNHKIRKIAPNGDVTTLAGSGSAGSTDGNGTSASFNNPADIAMDASGNVYVADQWNQKIRKINSNGDVSTLAGSGSTGSIDGNGSSASFNFPTDVAVDAFGNVYVADFSNNKIRKIGPNGDVTTLAGDGSIGSTDANGVNASFNNPFGVDVDGSGNVYVADFFNHKIRKITPTGDVTTVAGSGSTGNTDASGTNASFNRPRGVAVDAWGNVYVADYLNYKIRKMSSLTQLTGDATGNAGSHDVVLEADDGNGGITEQSFTVEVSDVPAVTTSAASSVAVNSATLNGEVTSDGEATILERGFVYSLTATDATPSVAESSGSDVTKVVVSGTTGTFSEALSDLTASTDYSFVAYATNSIGTAEGSVLTFTTSALTTPTITFENINRVYGDEDFALAATSNSAGAISYSIVGEANGSSLSGTNNEDVAIGDAGAVTIRATQAADDIYSSTTKDITLTIATKAITVTANASQTKVFGSADPTFAYSVTVGAIETGDSFTGSLSRTAGEDVGLYAIAVGTLSAGTNYDMTFVGADFRIILAGDTNGDGIIGIGEVVGDTSGDGSIGLGEIAGDRNGDGSIGSGELAGDTNGDGSIGTGEVAGDTNGDGSIGSGELAGDTNGDGSIGSGELAGDTNGDGSIGTGEVAGDTDGDGSIGSGELAGDADGDGSIGSGEIAGDTNGDGSIGSGELAGDVNGDGSIGSGELAGDINGDGSIDSGELAGDINGDGSIGSGELAGDTNGDGIVGDGEVAGDTNGDGVIGDGEVCGDLNGDGSIGEGESDGDANGDGVQDCDDLLKLGTLFSREVTRTGFRLTAVEDGSTYQWINCSNGNSAIEGATSQQFIPSASGTYAVEVTKEGCTQVSECIEVILLANALATREINVYPNPSFGNPTLTSSTGFDQAAISVHDLSGRVVWSVKGVSDESIELPIKELGSGLYLVRITEGKDSRVIRISKK